MDIDLGDDEILAGSEDQMLHYLQSRSFPDGREEASSLAAVHSVQYLDLEVGSIVSKIEDVMESMVDCLADQSKEMTISLRSRPRTATRGVEANATSEVRTNKVTFPGKSAQEAWKFTVLLRLLQLSHEALVNGSIITKRDIYYRDPELFLRQAVVDRYVDDLAFTFGVQRETLNVVAAAKGLVAGSLKIEYNGEVVVDCSIDGGGLSIPRMKEVRSLDIKKAEWVLVIEKEATFRALKMSRYWKDCSAGHGVLITAKGYPDIQTRQFLRCISVQNPHLPLFALVDFDPDGLGILSTYKHGSQALAHENENLNTPNLQWLGIRSREILSAVDGMEDQGLIHLTCRDRRKVACMLEHKVIQDDVEPEWRRELQVMLMLNVKAEIQILCNGRSLEDYLNRELSQQLC